MKTVSASSRLPPFLVYNSLSPSTVLFSFLFLCTSPFFLTFLSSLRQPSCKRGEARRHVERAVGVDGEEVVIPPHGHRPALDALAAYGFGDAGVVVLHFQRPEAEVASVEGFDGILPVAPPTAQTTYVGQLLAPLNLTTERRRAAAKIAEFRRGTGRV